MKNKIVKIWFDKASAELTFENVINLYEKGNYTNVYFLRDGEKVTKKYPTDHIFGIECNWN